MCRWIRAAYVEDGKVVHEKTSQVIVGEDSEGIRLIYALSYKDWKVLPTEVAYVPEPEELVRKRQTAQQFAKVRDAFNEMSDGDRAALLRVANYLAHRSKDEPMSLDRMKDLFRSALNMH